VEEFFEGWEGDPIALLLIVGKGNERKVRIKTDLGDKYDVHLAQLKVIHCSDELSMPLFDHAQNTIFIGCETELSVVNGKDRRMVEKVAIIALATAV
jgi:hypothetical protein